MLTVVVLLKLCVEIALLALAGQWVLKLLLGGRSGDNVVYGLLHVVTSPVVGLVGRLFPGEAKVRRDMCVAALLLSVLWCGATVAKLWLCLGLGVAGCR